MKASDVRSKYLNFLVSKGHVSIPPTTIVPENDPTTLFTGSGMQPMMPYLLGETHPLGDRLTDSQPSFRTDDIEEVGDNRHICMFEMIGNWSLGSYWKKEQLGWIFDFLTKEIGLDPNKLFVSVFYGDSTLSIPRDEEAIKIWHDLFNSHKIEAKVVDLDTEENGSKVGMQGGRIFSYGVKKNWWSRSGIPANMPAGEPGGPDSEIFYDFGTPHDEKYGKFCHPNCDCGRFLEIGNNVFMTYKKEVDGTFSLLPQRNIDFGGGLERIVAASNNNPDVFTIDMFSPIVEAIERSSGKKYEGEFKSPMRVIADHLRAATFMIAQGTEPSNKLQGYFLRRLLRRAAVRARLLGADAKTIFAQCIPAIVKEYADAGFIGIDALDHVQTVVSVELDKFGKALDKGLKEISKVDPSSITAQFAFDLYQSLGFPFEITRDLLAEKNITLNQSEFDAIFAAHKEGSRTASAGMFKGGLADQGEITTKFHTATHLLHQALYDVLGQEISQAGSNITSDRLRFDYTYSGKPTVDELKQIETIINDKIAVGLPVVKTIEDKEDALKSGVKAFFAEKYPDKVSVYRIGDYSRELCGGPHVGNTSEIGQIKISKDEALGSGKRRIYAVFK
ncbi:MAG: alanine--tRNA ligase [bacterium]